MTLQPALVFNCHYNGLSIIRELARRGVKEIFALDSKRSPGSYSRYATFIPSPDPLVDEQGFIEHLMKLELPQGSKPVLFPTNDHWACAVSRHAELLKERYSLWTAPSDVMELLLHKQSFYEWALEHGYPVPRSWRATNWDSISEDCFPIAAKPEFRVISSNQENQRAATQRKNLLRLTVLETPEALARFVDTHRAYLDELLLQEYIRGLSDCMYTVGVYANQHSEVLGVFTGRKLRGFPPDVGDCMVGQVESVPTALIDSVKEMCRELGYTGIGEFEYKRDAVSGEFRLIEINPRSWSWVGITPACGVSLPWMAYCDLTGAAPVSYLESNIPDGSVKFARVSDDRRNCLSLNRRAGFPEWHMSRREWRASLECKTLVRASFAWDDPAPGLYDELRHSLPFRGLRWARRHWKRSADSGD
ncbi:MAG: ATP-grasp domain-containing protein [Myxococcota bacterium]|nr:ATP-grasp domain-containing protein [Myxococcota bacterium]